MVSRAPVDNPPTAFADLLQDLELGDGPHGYWLECITSGARVHVVDLRHMAAHTQVSVEEYLRTSFDGPEPDYLDGEIVERGMPNLPHSNAQGRLMVWFAGMEEKWSIRCFPDLRLRVGERRYRVADLAVFQAWPTEDVPSTPPLVAIEILSPDDRFAEILTKLEEYRAWGVTHVWFVNPMSRKLYVYSAGLSEVAALSLPEYGVEIAAPEVFR